ncbi:hypothetical protein JCM8547_008329 [Rhodosporidiobolus lusitaniae]
MFSSSRAPPKPAGTTTTAPARPTVTLATRPAHARAPVALSSRPSAPSPLSLSSQTPPTPPSMRPRITTVKRSVVVTTTTKTVSTTSSPVRTLNALKRPIPPPSAKDEVPAAKRASSKAAAGKSKARAGAVSGSEDESSSEDEKRSKKRRKAPPPAAKEKKKKPAQSSRPSSTGSSSTLAANGPSSDLDPLTTSEEEEEEEEEEDSELSSADEDYFGLSPKKAEGAAVCDRPVAATGEGPMDGFSAERLVMENRKAYVEYFHDPSDPNNPTVAWAGNEVPVVELEFPAKGATERFALLAPRTDDEYNPIEDVMRTILTILDHFLTPDQARDHFAHLPGKDSFAAFLYNNTKSSSSSRAGTPANSTPRPGTPLQRSSSALGGSAGTLPSDPPAPLPTPPPSEAFFAQVAACATGIPLTPSESLVRLLEKARSKRDGPAFQRAVSRFNETLRMLKDQGTIEANIRGMKGLKEKVWQKVFYQCYDRAVGPDMDKLREYAAFSDNVYGELLPGFLNEIFLKTHLGPGKVFVDLGSGVGNCVVQAALATGASSYGFENMAHASHLARLQIIEAEKRFRMWGLQGGAMKAVEDDFCDSKEIGAVMRRADVVLVNNEVFSSSLNERLSWLFLDLPSSAKIISLKPFLPSKHYKITSHNAHNPFSILSQSAPLRYKPGSVSWKMEGGTYYLSRIDRTRVERFVEKEQRRERKQREEQERRRKGRSGSASGSAGCGGSRAPSRGA